MLVYRYNNNCVIPVHANICMFPHINSANLSNSISLYETFITEYFFESLNSFLSNESIDINYIIDLSGIKGFASRSFEKLAHDKKIIIVNIEELLFGRIKSDLETRAVWCNSSIISTIECNHDRIEEILLKAKRQYLVDIIKMDEISQKVEYLKYLDSSGVFSNYYVYIKNIFMIPNKLKFILYELSNKIISTYNTEHFDYLIASSPVGASIATSIGQIINKPIIYLNNLGPKFAINFNIKEKLGRNKKYLYIYDFICLGTEFKLVNSIIRTNSAELIGAIGVASLVSPAVIQKYFDDLEKEAPTDLAVFKINSLIYVNDKDIALGYKIYTDIV